MITAIRRGDPPYPAVVWDEWEGREPIPNGRIVAHRPSGCVFAVESGAEAFDLTARLVAGPEGPGVEDTGCAAIVYFTLVGQGMG